MIRSTLTAAAALALMPAIARADATPQSQVADAFIAAAQAQDHRAALKLLDARVEIEFPATAGGAPGAAGGQPFVIGYLDGLFGSDHPLNVDSQSQNGDAVRFQAHDQRSLDRYAIDVEVRGGQVVRLSVVAQAAPARTLAFRE